MIEKSAQQRGDPRETGEDREGDENYGTWKLRPLSGQVLERDTVG